MNISIEKILEIENRFAVEALKSVFLLNGVSAISILTFIGSVAVSNPANQTVEVSTLANPLFAFALGSGLSVAAYGAAFLAAYNMAMLYRYGKVPKKKIKKRDVTKSKRLEFAARIAAFFLGVASWFCFLSGLSFAFYAFQS